MEQADGERAATTVGFATLIIGAALIAAPDRLGRLVRIENHPQGLRVIGLADLALVPGLVRGRPRWPWMAGRAGLNLLFAGWFLRLARREGSVGAKIGALAMVLLTMADSNVVLALRQV